MTVVNSNGYKLDPGIAVHYMDDDIREGLHAQGYDTEQQFFDAYAAAHLKKYGEIWELDKTNPVW